jgi:hypothetical protein
MAIAALKVRRGGFGGFCRAAAYRHATSRECLPSAPLFGTTSARDAAMKDDYRQISRGTLARTNELSERAILWGMIFTALVAIAVTIKGMVG